MITVDENNRLIETLSSSEFNLKFETEIAAEKLKILENLGIYRIIDLPVGIIQFRSKFPGADKIHHTEIYPCLHESDRQSQVSYVFVHGCYWAK
jgi:tRNA-binding EMAP/Myf-like protein